MSHFHNRQNALTAGEKSRRHRILSRLTGMVARQAQIVTLLRNWRCVSRSLRRGEPLSELLFRNGVVVSAPESAQLAFLFNEIWIDRTYTSSTCKISGSDYVIDVGANVGVFTLFAASRGPHVHVFSYEPSPNSLPWLHKNVAASGVKNVNVSGCAVAGTA